MEMGKNYKTKFYNSEEMGFMDEDDKEMFVSEEEYDNAYELAKSNGINILRDKELEQMLLDGEKVIGCLFTGYDGGNNEFSFDIIVDKDYRRQGLGTELLKSALECFNNYEELGTTLHIDVITVSSKKLMEKNGLKIKEQVTNDRWIMSLPDEELSLEM